MILTIDVTVTGSDGTTASASAAVDVAGPAAVPAADVNQQMQQRNRALRWGVNQA